MILTETTEFSIHCHKELEIMYMMSGNLKMIYNQEHICLEPEDVIVIPPFVNHAFFSPETECRRLVIEVDLDIIDAMMYDAEWQKINWTARNMYSRSWDDKVKAQVRRIVVQMNEEYTLERDGWKFAVKTLLCQLILLIVRDFPKGETIENEKEIARLQSCIEYIGTNFAYHISLQECAGQMGFSPSYFSRYFKSHMGMTFQEYVKNLKIEKAKWLLISTDLPVLDISYQSGFSDIRTFNKIFKKTISESPSYYRKKYKKTEKGLRGQ